MPHYATTKNLWVAILLIGYRGATGILLNETPSVINGTAATPNS